MDDIENPEIINTNLLSEIKRKSKHFILLANGRVLPKIKFLEDIIVIGYKIGNVYTKPPNIYWGLDYAPVNIKRNRFRLKNNILVALGGAKGSESTFKVIKAISLIKSIKTIDFLESPVNPIKINKGLLRSDQTMTSYSNLPDIYTILSKAGIVISSYGHLAYETMASGTPLCLVNQKVFQNEYAKVLEKNSLCFSAGLLNNLSYKEIAVTIEKTLINADSLIKNTKKRIDGIGLNRISNIIYSYSKNI